MKKKFVENKRKCSIVKCGKMPSDGKGLMKIPWDSPCMTVLWKVFNTFGHFLDIQLIK